MNRDFTVVLRGYDRTEVDQALGRAEAALTSGSESLRAASLGELRKDFTVVLRGYDRLQVDQAVAVLATVLSGNGDGSRLRSAIASALRLDQPTDQDILDEVRRLRELADRA
jgi:DivIVA domain-containing protein